MTTHKTCIIFYEVNYISHKGLKDIYFDVYKTAYTMLDLTFPVGYL